MTFKVGDKVRLVSMPIFDFKIGDVHTVSRVLGAGAFSTKECDEKVKCHIPFHENYWKLVGEDELNIELAKSLLEKSGYTITPPPEPLKGKIVVYISADKTIWGVPEATYNDWSAYVKKEHIVLAIVDWTEGEGL